MTGALLSLAMQARIINRVIESIPLCRDNVSSVALVERLESWGRVQGKDMFIRTSLQRGDIVYTVTHECGHIIADAVAKEKKQWALFAKPPFVTRYAASFRNPKMQQEENFAESFARFKLRLSLEERKSRFISSLLKDAQRR